MAHAAGKDPYQFRRKLLAHRPDFISVLDTLAEKGDWGKTMAGKAGPRHRHPRMLRHHRRRGRRGDGHGKGEVQSRPRRRRARLRACGQSADRRRADRRRHDLRVCRPRSTARSRSRTAPSSETNFDTYPVVRLADTPKIEIYLALTGGKKWGGVGEPGAAPMAPAVANAIFAATGKRARSLPLKNLKLSGPA